jgi:hypothetical protein
MVDMQQRIVSDEQRLVVIPRFLINEIKLLRITRADDKPVAL